MAVESRVLSGEEEIQLRKLEKMKREIGNEVLSLLEDPTIIEVMLNPNGEVWIDSLAEGMRYSGIDLPAARALAFLETVADMLGEEFSFEKPVLEGELPLDGSRLEGHRPPITTQAAFSIRKKASAVFTLDEYVQQGRMTLQQKQYIEEAIRTKKNILIAGSTGSGKTTLTNALLTALNDIADTDRVVFIEDVVELQCHQRNQYAMRTSKKINVSITKLVECSMRLRPDRIIIGEVRDEAALSLLESWNTGHPGGITTIHSDSARDTLDRLEMLILKATDKPMCKVIARAVDIILYMKRTEKGPMLVEIAEVEGYDVKSGDYKLKYLLTDKDYSLTEETDEEKEALISKNAVNLSLQPTGYKEMQIKPKALC